MSQAENVRRLIAAQEAKIASRKAKGRPTRNLEEQLRKYRTRLRFYEAQAGDVSDITALKDVPGVAWATPTEQSARTPVAPVEQRPLLNFQQLKDMPIAEAEAYLFRMVQNGRMSHETMDMTRDALYEYHDRMNRAAREIAAATGRVREESKRLQELEADISGGPVEVKILEERPPVDILEERPYVPRPDMPVKLGRAVSGILFLSILAWALGASRKK